MVFQVVPSESMDEDGEAAAVLNQPRNQRVELLRVERELAAPARVRANEFLVHTAHRDAALRPGVFTQPARPVDRLRVEVDVGVIRRVDVSRRRQSARAPEALTTGAQGSTSARAKAVN